MAHLVTIEEALKIQHRILDLAKRNKFDLAKQLLLPHLWMINVQPSGRWSLLHQACYVLLISYCHIALRKPQAILPSTMANTSLTMEKKGEGH